MPAARTVTPSPPASIHTVEVQDVVVEDHSSDANERTSLLRTTSRNSGAKVYVTSKHGRVAKPTSAARRPATVEQEAVRVQQGQRVSLWCPPQRSRRG
jgi:Mrp family chromosome partitioning ATPase